MLAVFAMMLAVLPPDCDPYPDGAIYEQHVIRFDALPDVDGYAVYFKTVATNPWPTVYRCYCAPVCAPLPCVEECAILERWPTAPNVVYSSVTGYNAAGEGPH